MAVTVDEKRTGAMCCRLAVLLTERGVDFELLRWPVVVNGDRAVFACPPARAVLGIL